MERRAVIAGSLTRDRIEVRGRVVRRIGGSVWHAGTTLAALGINTCVVTRIAAADGDLRDALRAGGVDVQGRDATRRTTFVNSYSQDDPEDRTQQVTAVAEPIEAADLPPVAADADLVYLAPLHPDDLAEDIFAAVGSYRPPITALDVQGYTRLIENGVVTPSVDPRLPSLVQACHVLHANREEATLITGISDPSRAA